MTPSDRHDFWFALLVVVVIVLVLALSYILS